MCVHLAIGGQTIHFYRHCHSGLVAYYEWLTLSMAFEFKLFLNLTRPMVIIIFVIVFVIALIGLNVKIRELFLYSFHLKAVFSLLSGLQSIPLWVLSMQLITF
jgi:hypothetical protein